MHGVIFLELRKYVEERHGAALWREALERAGLADRIFLGIEAYPDAELMKLLDAVSEETGAKRELLLEELGAFVVPDLLRTYGSLAKPGWRTLELLENVETTIHRVVRLRDAAARPPMLQCSRTAPDEVTLLYNSPRRLCAFGRGIARGVARHYDQDVSIVEPTCMLRGAEACRIVVRLVK